MNNYILEMQHIRKTFLDGKVIANDDITLKILKGEKHAIVGENGAGKSTLMKMLNGLYTPTSGKIFYQGKEVQIDSPSKAAELGIGMVYQHFMLVPTLTVAENMILGVEPKKGLSLDIEKARQDVMDVSKKYGLAIDPDALISNLSIGMQQRVEILKILFKGANLLVFDEPTAVLTPQEIKELYKIMDNLIAEGKTIIFISHKLQEVLDISDNITVIRRGKDIANFPTKEATKEKIANAMVGRAVLFTTERPEVEIGEVVLSVKDVSVKDSLGVTKVDHASFEIRKGEVLGIAGVEGSGQTELVEALTGLKDTCSGEMILDNVVLKKKTPRKISKLGLAHIPEDRHKRAAVSQFSVMENFALGLERDEYSKFGLLNFLKLRKDAEMFMEKYDVRPRSVDTEFGRLSGGNQQKIIVARELEKKNNNLIIAGQPTRGVDIGAIESIHKLILNEKAKGKAVMVVSSELSEILNLSDKIAVMCAGKITGILSREEANEEKIGILMAGGKLD
ncbi:MULTISPECIES: ABC transporter ATP-binding protein [Cetobacterium]|uniref:ABC transporter ATP-binding protein n=1 Tax=Candidatus Cetobacterium colombiensis TaxID=3073100 RepID=A0ABU4W8E4_9FUSO|nr:ABC transporter ATP-binding protein [Candidatus Cetobacterium colombiensis]MDX8335790.1 ABC transporter ATP-binding protein [Candidatus Cetobacterium colombiensis]